MQKMKAHRTGLGIIAISFGKNQAKRESDHKIIFEHYITKTLLVHELNFPEFEI